MSISELHVEQARKTGGGLVSPEVNRRAVMGLLHSSMRCENHMILGDMVANSDNRRWCKYRD